MIKGTLTLLALLIGSASSAVAQSSTADFLSRLGNGDFARIVSIPKDCQSARELRRTQPNQRPFASPEICRAVLSCFEMVRLQIAAGLEFLKRQPGVDRVFRDQLHTMSPRDVRVDGWLVNLEKRLSFLNDVANVPSYSDCAHRGQFINEWISIIHPVSSPSKGLFDPSRGLFEKFSDVGQAVLTNARSNYKAIEDEYDDLINFNDRYVGVEQLEGAQAAYRRAFEDDDLAAMIRERPNVLKEMEKARSRKLLLTSQTDELVSLEKHFVDLTAILTQEPLSKLVSSNVPELSAKLQSQARTMRDTPPRLRGDVGTTLKELRFRETDIQNMTAAAQAKLESLKKRDDRRIEALKAIATIFLEFADQKIKRRLGASATITLANLHNRQTELLQYSNVPPVDQSDYDEVLTNVANDVESLRTVLPTIQRIDECLERTRALKTLIAGSDPALLDGVPISAIETLYHMTTVFAAKSLPLTDPDDKALVEACNTLSQLEKDIPTVMHKNEKRLEDQRQADQKRLEDQKQADQIRQKGIEYAKKQETYWKIASKRNEMTDKVDAYAESVQRNGQGVVAHITGSCENNAISFYALIVDEGGKPTVDLPLTLLGVSVRIRINDEAPQAKLIGLGRSFRNELELVSLFSAQTSLLPRLSDTWRVFVQFDTSMGEMVIKIPIYDASVQEMIKSCS